MQSYDLARLFYAMTARWLSEVSRSRSLRDIGEATRFYRDILGFGIFRRATALSFFVAAACN